MPVTIAPDGYSQNPPQTGIDALDTHWIYVTGRIQTAYPNIPIGGVVEARDWPFTTAIDQALYLVTGNVKNSRQVNSQQSQLVTYSARWAWMIIGSNLTQSEQAANRGDRYRIGATMRSAIEYGLYPRYTQKQQYSVVDNGSGVPVLAITTPYAYESVWWSKADFATKIDQVTGISFGYASVAISSFDPEINQ